MTTVHRPKSITPDEATDQILTRCYRGESRRDVIARAVRMLADADGHLHPNGTIKTGSKTTRRPA
ncbi:hypothetical protein [Streptomyces sp. KL116D]|uniref:hypothetical protein n=1 Tax=Streptomyces sp. KL116D TaxID=3045152 RepID=UPI003557B04A